MPLCLKSGLRAASCATADHRLSVPTHTTAISVASAPQPSALSNILPDSTVSSQLIALCQAHRQVSTRTTRTNAAAVDTYNDPAARTEGKAGDEESRAFAIAMAKIADETKCKDIVALDVAPLISWTSFMVICTVYSKPQLMAAIARMEKAAEEEFGRQKQNQPGNSPWEILDFGSVVVQVFTPEQREYYDIESFYATAEEIDLPFAQQPEPLEMPSWTTKF